MSATRTWTNAELEWYHNRKLDRTPWWSDFAFPVRKDGKREIPLPPLYWEVLRRHPDTGLALSLLQNYEAPSEIWKGWLEGFFGWQADQVQILECIANFGTKCWPILKKREKKTFEELTLNLVRAGRISTGAHFVNPKPICDILGSIRLSDLHRQIVPPSQLSAWEEANRQRRRFTLGSLNEMTLEDLLTSVSMRGQDLLILAVDRNSTKECVRAEVNELVNQKRGTQTLADHARLSGSYPVESKRFCGPPPPKELVSLFMAQNPEKSVELLTYGDEWQIRWFAQLPITKERAKRARTYIEHFGCLGGLDSKSARSYPMAKALFSKFALFVL